MDLYQSEAGLLAMGAGICAYGSSVGYICCGRDFGRPWLLALIGSVGWLALAAGVVLAQIL